MDENIVPFSEVVVVIVVAAAVGKKMKTSSHDLKGPMRCLARKILKITKS